MICPYTSCGQIPCIVYLMVISILLSDEFFAFTPTGNKIRHDLLCMYICDGSPLFALSLAFALRAQNTRSARL